MSLINRMLQDLEERRPGQTEVTALPEGVRVVAENRPRRLGWVLLALALVAALIWGLARLSRPANPVDQPRPDAVAELPPELKPSLRLASVPSAPAKAEHAPAVAPAPHPIPRGREQTAVSAPAAASTLVAAEKTPAEVASTQAEAAVKRVSPAQRAEFLYQKALGLLQQGRVAEAQGSLEDALSVERRHAAARRLLAGLLVEAKRYQEAEQVLEEGLRLHVDEAVSAMALARLRVERGDSGGGLELLQQYLPQGEDSAAYQAFLATLLQQRAQHRQAAEHFQAALRLAPGNGLWLVGLGISLQADNRPAEALDAFGRAKAAGGLSPELQAFVDQRLAQLRAQQP